MRWTQLSANKHNKHKLDKESNTDNWG